MAAIRVLVDGRAGPFVRLPVREEEASLWKFGGMDPAFVLVHSLLLGPSTWAPVAARLASSGFTTVVPSLVDVTDADDPPFWPHVVNRVADAASQLPHGLPIFVVAHSNAGLYVPAIVHASRRPVAGCLFIEASLPSRDESTATASLERLNHLRTRATGDRLPQWTDWWDEQDVAMLFPDQQTRSTVTSEQPRLPLSYYEQQIPVPEGWDDRPCGYLLFGPAYDHMAREARARGWAVDQVPGHHLHHIVDPDAVTARITAMTRKWH